MTAATSRMRERTREGISAKAKEITYTLLIDGPCRYSYTSCGLANKGLMIEANEMFNNMLKRSIDPDPMIYDVDYRLT